MLSRIFAHRRTPKNRAHPNGSLIFSYVFRCAFLFVPGSLFCAAVYAQPALRQAKSLEARASTESAAGEWPLAISDLEKAAQIAPHDARVRVSLGEAFAATRQFAAAIASFQDALRISPRDARAELDLAQAYRQVHNYDEARRILTLMQAEHPKDSAPLAALGGLDIEVQNYDAAIEHLKAALVLDPSNTDTRNALAVAYRAKGDTPHSLDEVARILARDPNNALAHFTRAQIYADGNQDAPALRDAEKTLELQPENPRGRELLGELLLRAPKGATPDQISHQCARAVTVLEPLLPAQQSDSKTLYLLARAYRCAGRAADAEKAMANFAAASQNDRATKENQTQAKHLVEQSDDLAIKNDFPGALALLQQAIAKDPTYGPAYSQLAKLYYSAGQMDKASEAVGQALARDAYEPDFLYVQGKILEKQGKLEESLGAFTQSTLVDPKESDAFFEMGAIYERQHQRAKAIAAYRKALTISPGDADYRRALDALTAAAP